MDLGLKEGSCRAETQAQAVDDDNKRHERCACSNDFELYCYRFSHAICVGSISFSHSPTISSNDTMDS